MTIEQIRSYLGQTEEQFNSAISALKEKEPQIISGGYAFETYFDGKIVLNINSLRSHLVEDSFITTGVIVALNFGIKKVQIYYTSDIKDAIFYYRTTETSNFPLSWEIIEESRMFAESSMLANVRNLAVPTIVGSGTGISFSNVHKIPTVANTSKVESKLISSTGEVPSSNDNGDANKPISEIADRLKFIGDEVQERAIIRGLKSGATELKYGLDLNTLSGNSCYLAVNGNLPIQNEFALVTTNTNAVNDTGMQVANFLSLRKVYERPLQGGVWLSWNLIAQDQEPINTHMSDTVKHVTQAEKDAWNGKATIKGLESGTTELKYGLDLNTLSGNSCYLAVNGNLPIQNEFALVTTNTNAVNDTGMQVANFLSLRKVYERSLQGGVWLSWNLISAPKMFATGYIGTVTFNGTTPVIKSVLFDDGVTRSMAFYKTESLGTSYYYTNNNGGYNIVSITAGSLMSYSVIDSNAGYLFFLGGIGQSNTPFFATSSSLTVKSIIITIFV